MEIIMKEEQLSSINDLANFIKGSQKIVYAILANKQDKYLWVQSILIKFEYYTLNKSDKGIVQRYIQKITDYSRQQLSRLINQHKKSGYIGNNIKNGRRFELRYTKDDVQALVAIDETHGTLNGIATKKLCERSWHLYNDSRYERLARISVAHLYNLRNSTGYRRQRILLEKTKPVKSAIGKRRKPEPNGKPGYLRLDTVHQGDHDGKKGVYHINAVDEVTQFEIVCSVEKISEQYLIPILQDMLGSFPFTILGFHSDNGSEYVNKVVAKLLNKLLIEFTKSRPRKSGDNGLVESKNGSIIRKMFGYMYISQQCAEIMNTFNKTYLNYYLNYHRPCLFSNIKIDKRGKEIKQYKYENVFTPYEKLKSLPEAAQYLKQGVTFDDLDIQANKISDSEAARQMNTALKRLFNEIDNHKEQTELVKCSSA
jgi:transposase InsO family protein